MLRMARLRVLLQKLQDAKGWELATYLHRAARHTNVQLLQVALLDHLAAHAGMGVELEGQQQQWEWKFELQREQQEEDAEQPEAEAEVEAQESGTGQPVVQGAEKEGEERKGPAAGEEGVVEQGTAAREEGEGEQEGREGQQSDEGEQGMESEAWDGSSGLWRVAKEEVRLGKITRVYKDLRAARDPRITVGPTGLLKSYHTDIVCACLGDWTAGCHEMVADAGLPARPHPVLQAQHACRAAEALCRLYRGQGLGGAYGPEPSFDDGAVEALKRCSRCIIPYEGFAAALPVDVAQECLPLWLGAAGWVAATAADATVAAMGTWHQQGQQEPTSSSSGTWDGQAEAGGCREATWLCGVVQQLQQLAANRNYGYETLPPAAQADVRRRLHRCGLAASLDRALRMLYSAQDSGRTGIATALEGVATAGGALLGVAPVLQPSRPAVCVEDGGSDGANAAAAADGRKGTAKAPAEEAEDTNGSGGGGRAAAAPPGGQLGVVLTLSKRAALLTRALEVVHLPPGAATEAAGGAAADAGTGAGALERGPVVWWAGVTLSALVAAARGMEGELVCRAEASRTAQEEKEMSELYGEGADSGGSGGSGGENADSGGGGSGGGIKAWGVVSVCESEAHEALVLAVRAASNLAAPLAWQLAANARTMADVDVRQDGAVASEVLRAVGDLLFLLAGCCRHPAPLPPAQLLACQPHRLLAAACALAAAALPEQEEQEQGPRQGKSHLCAGLACLLVALSSHEVLSGKVRSWLAPPPPRAAATVTTSNADACTAGCLAACVQPAMQLARSLVPVHAAHGLALLDAEGGTKGAPGAGSGGGSAGGDGDTEWAVEDAEEGYRMRAASMAAVVCRAACRKDPSVVEQGTELAGDLLLPDGSCAGGEPPTSPPTLLWATWAVALPPLLALPAGWARGAALPWLRVCGSPRCCNFACESEGALPFKQCGGCRAVRYCGADCQRAHWREGHRAECKALAAGAVV